MFYFLVKFTTLITVALYLTWDPFFALQGRLWHWLGISKLKPLTFPSKCHLLDSKGRFFYRSATFADLGLYNEALRDITRALKTKSYPEKLKYKLLERKAKCLMVLNFTFQSKSCFKEALQALQSSDLDDVKKNFISENIRNSINNIVLVDDETLNSGIW